MATVPSTGVLAAIALLCMPLVATPVQADSAPDMKQGSALLFPAAASGAEPIPFELALPLSRLKKLKAADTQEFAARLTLKDGTELPLKVSPRGKSRRKQCDFPPLRLDFKKKATDGSIFAGQNKLKLVTHCSRRLARGGYLAAEMLAYRLFNTLTDASFRVRAVQIDYVDTDKEHSESWPGFVIEHKTTWPPASAAP